MSDNGTTEIGESRVRRTSQAARSGLDVMLSEAAAGGPPRFIAPGSAVKVTAGLARHPGRVISRAAGLGAELARTAAGRSELAPAKGDRRFGDRAWEGNWLFRRVLQGYLAVGETVDGLITDADVDWRAERRARLAAGNVLDALAPTNFAWSNPTVIKETVDTGGGNLVRGARQFVHDLSTPPTHLPATVDTSKFEVGGNLAASPGSVVLRTDVFELIHYKPATEQVREVPLLFVPPTINKFYVLDLAPGRSMIEHYVAQGQQVFVMSWRNPEQAAGSLRPRHVRAGGRRGPRRGRLDHGADRRSTSRPRARAESSPPALLGELAATGELGRRREPDADGVRARQRHRGHDVGARDARRRGRGRRRVRAQGLPRRAGARGRVHVASPERPRLELLRQQLPARQGAAGVRHPVLEPGHGPSRGGASPGLHPRRTRQLVRAPGRARGPRRSRSTSGRSTSTRTSSPAPPITSSRGRARTRARSCSAATSGSCCRGAVTSRRSSTRRARTAVRASASPTSCRRQPRSSARRRRSCRAAGGPTGTRGWPSAPAS